MLVPDEMEPRGGIFWDRSSDGLRIQLFLEQIARALEKAALRSSPAADLHKLSNNGRLMVTIAMTVIPSASSPLGGSSSSCRGLRGALNTTKPDMSFWKKMTNYAEKLEDAIVRNDIDQLIKYAYGDACRCHKVKGEPLCVCKMFAEALRKKIAPRALFHDRIERVSTRA